MTDRFDLARFAAAQAPCIDRVRAELQRGRKESHWMWFIFPQIAGLGSSDMARRFAISGLREARAYEAEATLGTRLRELTGIVTALRGDDAVAVFGSVDAQKFRSSMTLFGRAVQATPVFRAALEKYFGGAEDAATLAILRRAGEVEAE
ncbi:MAG TPA: DUF1810 domain-containing protein [Acetobacteraceae bacterium]|nr:DUF1810 domain-containing protein [Acetobacteraceae bacterium]